VPVAAVGRRVLWCHQYYPGAEDPQRSRYRSGRSERPCPAGAENISARGQRPGENPDRRTRRGSSRPVTLQHQVASYGAMPSIFEGSPPISPRRIGSGRKTGPRLADALPHRSPVPDRLRALNSWLACARGEHPEAPPCPPLRKGGKTGGRPASTLPPLRRGGPRREGLGRAQGDRSALKWRFLGRAWRNHASHEKFQRRPDTDFLPEPAGSRIGQGDPLRRPEGRLHGGPLRPGPRRPRCRRGRRRPPDVVQAPRRRPVRRCWKPAPPGGAPGFRHSQAGQSGGPRGVVACSSVAIPLRHRDSYNASGSPEAHRRRFLRGHGATTLRPGVPARGCRPRGS
jgi:hypothetical protein